MKKAIVVVLVGFVMATSSVHAEDNYQFCDKVAKLAERIMEARQKGVKMRDLIRDFNKEKNMWTSLSISLTKSAYDSPRFGTEKYQKKAETKFSNRIYGQCLKELE